MIIILEIDSERIEVDTSILGEESFNGLTNILYEVGRQDLEDILDEDRNN